MPRDPQREAELFAAAVSEMNDLMLAAWEAKNPDTAPPSNEILDVLSAAVARHVLEASLLACTNHVLEIGKQYRPDGFYSGTQVRDHMAQVGSRLIDELEHSQLLRSQA